MRAIVASLTVVGLLTAGEVLAAEHAPALPPVPVATVVDVTDVPEPAPSTPAVRYWDDPAAHHWAVLIGINEYAGSTEDAIGSRQDAQELYKMLLRRGWRSSNIRLILDERATADRIAKSINWLARNTTSRSRVIFHYAGHEMPFYSDRDGDAERRDVAIWATDNRYLMDGHLGALLGQVRARAMWVHFATCRAGGFNDPGIAKRNRVVTYSSPEEELSYEDPSVKHSVFGYFSIIRAIRHKQGDTNGNGRITVEEAFRWARKPVIKRTSDRQHPLINDRLDGTFRLKVPAPRAEPSPPPPGEDETCVGLFCP